MTGRGPRHARRLRGHGALRGVALTLSAALLFGVSAVATFALRLQANLDTIDIGDLVGDAPGHSASGGEPAATAPGDPSAGRAVNVLVLGSDYRDAATTAAEGRVTAGMRADTTIVVHLAADRARVEAVSIPRDSLVAIPSCTMSDGSTTAARSKDLINSAFATGWDHGGDLRSAAACAVRAVQENTGLTIDHVVVVDFAGLQTMVDAIGGVDICIPQDMHDDHTGLTLAAGRRVLDGETAVKFARDRYDDAGDRSDIFRIGNQQRLVAAMAGQVLSRDVLTDVTTLVPFLTAATASLTTDLSLPAMTGLAYAARGIRADRITFLTIPWADAPGQWGRVVWTKDADAVWQNLAADRPIVGAEPTAEGEGTTNGGAPDAGAAGAGVPGTGPAGASTRSPVTTSAPGSSSAAPDTPTPAQTKRPGREPFTPADVTAICS